MAGYYIYYGTVPIGTRLYSNRAGGFLTTCKEDTDVTYAPTQDGGHTWANFNYKGMNAWCREDALTDRSSQWIETTPSYAASVLGSVNGNAIGQNISVNYTVKSAGVQHWLRITLGSKTAYLANYASGSSYTVPMDWCNALPNQTQGTATIDLETWRQENGKWILVGKQSKTQALYVPSYVVPSIGSFTVSPTNLNNAFSGEYVQLVGKLTWASTASGQYGASIQSVQISIDGRSYTGANGTSGFLANAGTSTVTCIVKDSRGRKAEQSKSITIRAYQYPQQGSLNIVRCNRSGAADDRGDYAMYTGAPITYNGENRSITSYIKQGDVWVLKAPSVIDGKSLFENIALQQTHAIKTVVSDDITSSTFYYTIYSSGCLMNVKRNCVAFGGYATEPNTFEVFYSFGETFKKKIGLRRVDENGIESEAGQYVQVWNGSEWLWDSIPNKLGVEYKTTRLYLDKPVYACKLDFPIANNGSATQMPAETEAFLVEQNLLFKSNDGQYRFMLPYLDPQYPIYLSLRGRGVMVHKNTGWGDGRIYGTVYYTKGVPV